MINALKIINEKTENSFKNVHGECANCENSVWQVLIYGKNQYGTVISDNAPPAYDDNENDSKCYRLICFCPLTHRYIEEPFLYCEACAVAKPQLGS